MKDEEMRNLNNDLEKNDEQKNSDLINDETNTFYNTNKAENADQIESEVVYTQEEKKENIENVYNNVKVEKKPKKGKKKLVAAFVAVAVVASMVGGMLGGALVSYNLNVALDKNQANYEAVKNGSLQQVSINLSDDDYFAVAVAEKSQKSVVGITTTETRNNPFYGKQTATGMGSGVIFDSNGYILTNSHVIGDGNATDITVSLIDGTKEPGTVLWYEPSLDLAVIKIEKTGLPAAEIGDSSTLKVGEPVVAIGNPMSLELERTVTQGIISGLNRSITVENGTTIKPLIQTDASINSGNSGGPLFNAKGQVIGINTAKMSSAEGLGFAIPINTAKSILDQVTNNGSVSSVYVGIKGLNLADYENSLGIDLSAEYGVVVIEAVKDSPADKAGLEMGDIIQKIDNEKTESMNDLKAQLYNYNAGDKVKLTILRNNQELSIEMTLQEKPKDY